MRTRFTNSTNLFPVIFWKLREKAASLIPAISDAECSCDEIKKTKFSKFTLNEEEVNIGGWIVTNGLKLEQDLYFRQGKNKHTIWEATFDPASNELEIKIEYL